MSKFSLTLNAKQTNLLKKAQGIRDPHCKLKSDYYWTSSTIITDLVFAALPRPGALEVYAHGDSDDKVIFELYLHDGLKFVGVVEDTEFRKTNPNERFFGSPESIDLDSGKFTASFTAGSVTLFIADGEEEVFMVWSGAGNTSLLGTHQGSWTKEKVRTDE